jgi:hypothetical protein
MEERSITDTYVKESLIGIAAASFSIVVIVAMMEGGGRAAFSSSITLLLYGYIAPFIFLPVAPWLIVVIALAGVALYQQYRLVPPRFMRYLVGGEVIVWQVISFQIIANLLMQ